MKKLFLFLLALSFIGHKIIAKEIDYATAKSVAVNFSATVPVFKTTAQEVNLIYTKKLPKSTNKAFYVFNISNSGFVMISADDNIEPILAYSTESVFDTTNIPSQLKFMLDHYLLVAAEISVDTKINASANAAWDAYKQGQQLPSSRAQVAPLLTTKWGQSGNGYNKFCPGGSLTGCVATAVAQILKYHNYPAKGNYHSEYGLQQYGRLYTNYDHPYDWANMPSVLTSTSTTVQQDAVARLMSDVGRAANMCYTPTASGTFTQSADYALWQYFGMDHTTTKHIPKSTMSNQAWINMLKAELNNARPIYYAASDTIVGGGHAFVLDGYDNSGLFHVNWGWDGQYEGYFNIAALNPGSKLYNAYSEVIVGIAPPAKTPAVPVLTSKILGPAKSVYKTPLKYTFTIKNTSADTIEADLGLDLYDSRLGGRKMSEIPLSQHFSYTVKLKPLASANITIVTDSAILIPTGKYKAYFTWINRKTGVSSFLQQTSAFSNNLPLEIHHTAVSGSVAISSAFTISNKSTYEDGKPFSVKVTLKNTSTTKNYSGKITAKFYDPYGYEVDDLQTLTVKIDKGKTKVCTFQKSALSINDHGEDNIMFFVQLVDETDINIPKLIAATTGNSSCAPISYAYTTCNGDLTNDESSVENNIKENNDAISIFPNPSSTSATIRFKDNASNATIQILNMLGSSVFEKTITNEKELIISTEHLPNGMYFIVLKDNANGVLNTKMQVIH